jgi:PAS domain-containing protein
MYNLSPEFKYNHNVAFLLEFEQHECIQYDKTYPDIIKTWWGHPKKFRADVNGIYATVSLDTHMIYVDPMLCRLFGKNNSTHFLITWVPIMHKVAEGYSFNWAKMLLDNLAKEIIEYQLAKSKGHSAPFYMSTYIMDIIFFMTPFPLMN